MRSSPPWRLVLVPSLSTLSVRTHLGGAWVAGAFVDSWSGRNRSFSGRAILSLEIIRRRRVVLVSDTTVPGRHVPFQDGMCRSWTACAVPERHMPCLYSSASLEMDLPSLREEAARIFEELNLTPEQKQPDGVCQMRKLPVIPEDHARSRWEFQHYSMWLPVIVM
ncbi:unnamed protein product [Boreogadus saida]